MTMVLIWIAVYCLIGAFVHGLFEDSVKIKVLLLYSIFWPLFTVGILTTAVKLRIRRWLE